MSGLFRARLLETLMFTRVCRIAAIAAGGLLALIGLLAFPFGVLIAWALAAALAGPIAALCVPNTLADLGNVVRIGAAATAAAIAVSLPVAGLFALLGAAAVPVIALLLAAGAVWAHRRRPTWRGQIRALVTGGASDGSTGRHGAEIRRCDPRRGHDTFSDPASEGPPALAQLRAVQPGALPTTQLCAAWQRSYWLLRDLPAGPARCEVVTIRQGLLAELERRDPAGFARWLQTDPRAGGDPSRYLSADH